MMTKLTNKQTRFVEEFLIDLNATQAAIRAGYSKRTAKEIGHQNLTKLHIQSAIQKLMDQRSEDVRITAEEVIVGIAKIAFNKNHDEDVTPNNRLKGLELLGKHLGLFTDKKVIEHRPHKDKTDEELAAAYREEYDKCFKTKKPRTH